MKTGDSYAVSVLAAGANGRFKMRRLRLPPEAGGIDEMLCRPLPEERILSSAATCRLRARTGYSIHSGWYRSYCLSSTPQHRMRAFSPLPDSRRKLPYYEWHNTGAAVG